MDNKLKKLIKWLLEQQVKNSSDDLYISVRNNVFKEVLTQAKIILVSPLTNKKLGI